MLYPEALDKGGRGHKRASERDGVSATRLKLARTVLRYSSPLARRVMADDVSLDQAFWSQNKLPHAIDIASCIQVQGLQNCM
jgi:hypothetical protein